MDLSRAVVTNKFADEARVFIVSQIGKPINEPHLLHFQLKNRKVGKERISNLARGKLAGLSDYWQRITLL